MIGLSLALSCSDVLAAPLDGVVNSGNANIATVGSRTTITQTTNKAIIDWQSFDTSASEQVQFHQSSADAIALNRIHDSKPTQFDGQLNANGNVWLVNPHGMVFGRGAQVDVGGLIASTSNISEENFNKGDYRFDQPGDANAAIINRGSIQSKSGLIGFLASLITNEGSCLGYKSVRHCYAAR